MDKTEIENGKVSYATNTCIKYIKRMTVIKMIYVQHKHEDYQLRVIIAG